MNRALFLVLLLAALTACKKREAAAQPGTAVVSSQPAANSPDASAVAPTGPVTALPEAIVVEPNANVDATLEQLSLELRKFVLRSKTSPKSFEEFASQAHVQAPAAPAGRKYVIAGGRVVLGNQ